MEIKKKISPRDNEITVDAVLERLEPVLRAGNKVTPNFSNRMFALEKKSQANKSNKFAA
tara:strand:- start:237 stop:413 length:177 start_codon:yes stop_codon:yes gene_type:complete